MKKTLQIANAIAFIIVIIINYVSVTGALNNTTIGEISDSYNSLFTPAGYAFSIWGIIYLLLFGFVVYQGRSLFVSVANDDFVLKTGWWFVLSCVFNSIWVFAWVYEYTGLSCVLIFLLLMALVKIVINNRMELDDEPFPTILCLWWPFVIYSGWVTVASIVNISSYLVKLGWDGFGLSESVWTIIMIVAALIINQYVLWKRNMREFAAVGAWALIAIGIANKGTNAIILYAAFIGAAILLISTGIHGYKNRATNPFLKLKQSLSTSK
ncbi:tryptophan-rich sensory protein [Winogradskyella schleiferi]|uniref:tryptophan-rich sensory protein n=1 Tax=Winogradskyella schleiferi TaxID=2686078 RepID=UPI0015BA01CB|nr:tryptophan-rich sensory protein [Winogradskyella schleiferi]